jgi:hypothetical protein
MGLKYRKNNLGYSCIISLDVQNITNRKNVLGNDYAKRSNNWIQLPQNDLGLVPILNFRVEF